MIGRTWLALAGGAALALSTGGCAGKAAGACPAAAKPLVVVTIAGAKGTHHFCVETAATEPEQQRGLMFRTDLTPDGGMLFWPYPPDGSAPREASFWMKNTPTSLDIVFIRPDGTIARIADHTDPFSEMPVSSGEPVGAVLELVAGRTAALGIGEGDRVSWPGRK